MDASQARNRQDAAALGTPAVRELIGRESVLAWANDALSTQRAMVLIEGEPGIGKSRLVVEMVRSESVARRGLLVVTCPPLREPFPLGPVVDALRRHGDRVRAAELTALGGALRPLFPEWSEFLPPSPEHLDDPKETRHRLLRAITELVERLGIEIVVVEDAHWADNATLEWLISVTSGQGHGPSTVITYRPNDVPPQSVLRVLTSRPRPGMKFRRERLEPLDVEQTRRMVGAMLGSGEVSEEFAAFLRDHTDGIPLAIEECVRLLRDRNDIVWHGGHWIRRVLDDLDVPPTVRDSVLERAARLPPPARLVLEAAAVLAEPVDESMLSAVAGLTEAEADAGIAAALASGILQVQRPGQYVFRHALDAQAIGEAIAAPQWRRMHVRAAEVLRRADPPPVVRLARHCREAGDDDAWCRYVEASAGLLLESGQDRMALVTLLELLTSIEHPPDRRVRLARLLGETWPVARDAQGEFAGQVVAVLRTALASGGCEPADRGELRLVLGDVLWILDRDQEAFEEWQAAVPDLTDRPGLAVKAMANLALPMHPDWPIGRHLQWLDRSTELARTLGPEPARSVPRLRETVLLLVGEEAGWEQEEVTVDATTSRAEQGAIASGLLNVVMTSLHWGRYVESHERLAQASRFVDATGYRRLATQACSLQLQLDWHRGRWDGLLTATEELVDADVRRDPTLVRVQLVAALLHLAAGNRTASETLLDALAEQNARSGTIYPDNMVAPAALARIRLADESPDGALALTAPVMDAVGRKGVWLWAADVAPVHVEALIAIGRTTQAEDLVSRYAGGLVGRDAPAPAASFLVCAGLMARAHGDHDRAAGLFDDAARRWAQLPRPYDGLLARERQGLSLMDAGRPDEGVAGLTQAERQLRELGARWDADRIARVLRRHGVGVSRAWKGGPHGYGDALTPREKDVLTLVAQGMTNREAAQALFLSPKTVGIHLGTAMRKLGVNTRTGAAMAANDAGLISFESDVATN
ncbi:helix-turn-helix transcriptional regulator [Jiangella endophytica]|uniref:helix-turn-helix transcriptional regulator n=1 Tax=Jiangella endophytica TaxID=1623398 RepID=UPI0018E5202B|nr:LuxR C-terminal-related transcriptional regulator [Jiangella endophytica]